MKYLQQMISESIGEGIKEALLRFIYNDLEGLLKQMDGEEE